MLKSPQALFSRRLEVQRTEQGNRAARARGGAFASSLAAAALDGLFDHPAGCSCAVPDLLECCVAPMPKGFSNNLLDLDGPFCPRIMPQKSLRLGYAEQILDPKGLVLNGRYGKASPAWPELGCVGQPADHGDPAFWTKGASCPL